MPSANYIWAILRIGMGWVFLWPFLDKTFALGFATEAGRGWLSGSSPAMGFLKFGSSGPLAGFYQGLAGNPVVDWLYMLGLLGVGIAFILGIALRIAAFSGALMMLLIYSAALPVENNPNLRLTPIGVKSGFYRSVPDNTLVGHPSAQTAPGSPFR